MKHCIILFISLGIVFSCKQKVLAGAELDKKLISTMQDYLDKDPHPGVTFKVKDVTYFTDQKRKEYNCDFHVDMRINNKDTVGLMSANIPNDFSTVDRRR